jgi:putative phosphoribosyl transferase
MEIMFKNRQDAAQQLADKLSKYKEDEGVVLAVPRGGVPVGYEIAQKLDWPLDIVLSKKIGHPTNKEYAIGAVSLTGQIINQDVPVSRDYIEDEIARIRTVMQNTYHKYMEDKAPEIVTDKTVILTDDGVATGHTLLSTLDLIKRDKPAKIVVAIPVSSPEALRKIEERVDEVICLGAPVNFRSVGQFYETFDQTTDEEVVENLHGRRYFEA